jgi:hypothetical protein
MRPLLDCSVKFYWATCKTHSMIVAYTIRYGRPEALWSVTRMVVTGDVEQAQAHVNRLRNLGYTIIANEPPLEEAP